MFKMIIDKSNMYQAIKNFPDQFIKAIEFANGVKVTGQINKIVITGMGGSALPGDVVKTYLDDITTPIEISRSYSITTPIDTDTLVFASSFSGNTEETISSFYDALNKNAKIIVVSAGGKLEELANEYNLPMVKIIKESKNFQPRFATGYFFGIFIKVLSNCEVISDREKELIELSKFLKQLDVEKDAKILASKLIDSIPIIYTSNIYEFSVARIIKIKFNENSKIQAFFNAFPELNHNEMVGFTNIKGNYHFLMIEDADDHPRNKKRMQIFKDILKEKKLNFTTIPMQGNTPLAKIFSTLYLFDFVSYFLALEYKVDPTPVDMVEEFKKALEK
jgi:glucose/mannose-6-phosphate isomerase